MRTRILLVLLGLLVPSLLLVELMSQRSIGRLVEERALARLDAESRLVGLRLGRGGWSDPAIDETIDEEAAALGVRITLVGSDGRVLADSERDGEELARMENHAHRPEIAAALERGRGLAIRHSDTVEQDMHYLATRLPASGGETAVLRLAIPSEEVTAAGRAPSRAILGAAAGTILVVAVLGYVLARRASSPIETLHGMARSLAESGAVPVTAPDGGPAEVREIGRSLERVGGMLREQVEAISQERNLLRTILAGMREGLLIVDGDERVALANGHARVLFPGHTGPLEGRSAVELVRDPEFLALLRSALGSGLEGQERLSLPDGRVLEMRVAPLEGPGLQARGALALILDVTLIERLEGVRRDFVANVSHELRTPLSSIKAFVETLLDEVPPAGNARSFLETIQRNAGRMEDLVNDLTDLSLIETGAIALSFEEVEVRPMVLEVFRMLARKAEERNVTLECRVPPGTVVHADIRRLTQVMSNLADNAVKFNRQGGRVTVTAEPAGDGIALAVSDQGPGIPEEHRENVFHRFFRVPGSPERTGTGLGLAIVKHLMRLHGGTIDVASRVGEGSTFRVVFPAGTAADRSGGPQGAAAQPPATPAA